MLHGYSVVSDMLVLPICALLQAVAGLRLTELVGPPYPDRGDDVRLTCTFDTEGAKLYSVKWYKDENEFFRYMPDNWPQTQVFTLVGVELDTIQQALISAVDRLDTLLAELYASTLMYFAIFKLLLDGWSDWFQILNGVFFTMPDTSSGINHVTLMDVVFHSSGSYRCEISTEAPSFETVFLNHNMTVLSYPQGEPELTGALDMYSAGDLVSVNCSAPPSYPPPSILFYNNGIRAEEWLVERGPLVLLGDGTTSTSAALRFRAEPQHFRGPHDVLELRCQVEAPPLPPSATTKHLYLTPSPHHRLAQHTFRNRGTILVCCSPMLFVLLLLLVL